MLHVILLGEEGGFYSVELRNSHQLSLMTDRELMKHSTDCNLNPIDQ